MYISVFVNSYLRGRSYFTYGAGSSTDGLQAWTRVLWNSVFRRKLSRCSALRDHKTYGNSSPGWNTLSPFLVWLCHGRFDWLARDYSQQREGGTQLGNSIRSCSLAI